MQSWRKALFYLSQIGTAELRRYNINTRGLPYKGKMYFYIIVLWADPLLGGFVLWVGSDTQSPAAEWAQPAFGSSNGYEVWVWGWVEWQKLRLGSWKEPSFCWTKVTCECFLLKTVLERQADQENMLWRQWCHSQVGCQQPPLPPHWIWISILIYWSFGKLSKI